MFRNFTRGLLPLAFVCLTAAPVLGQTSTQGSITWNCKTGAAGGGTAGPGGTTLPNKYLPQVCRN